MLTLLNWQRALPAELMRRQIKVRLAIAWGLSLVMRSEEALQLVAEIEQDLINNEGPAREALICECLTIRAIAVAVADDSHQALQIAEILPRSAPQRSLDSECCFERGTLRLLEGW